MLGSARIVHRGSATIGRWDDLRPQIAAYMNQPSGIEEAMINRAKQHAIGDDRQDVIDALFGKRIAPRKTLDAAYDVAVEEADTYRDFSPRSAWAMAQGLTTLSQATGFADGRTDLDRAAGRVLALAS